MSESGNGGNSFSAMCREYGCDEDIYSVIERGIMACSPLLCECAAADSRIKAGAFSSDMIIIDDIIEANGKLRKAVFRIDRGLTGNIKGALVYEGDRNYAVLLAGQDIIIADIADECAGGYEVLHGDAAEDYLRSRLPFFTAKLAKREKMKTALLTAAVIAAVLAAFAIAFLLFSGGDTPDVISIVSPSTK